MKKTLAIITATLLTSTAAFAAPLANGIDQETIILAQAADNDIADGESPAGPIVDEEERMGDGEPMPDGEGVQADNDIADGESPAGPIVDEEEQMGDGEPMPDGEGVQADNDIADGESPAGPIVE